MLSLSVSYAYDVLWIELGAVTVVWQNIIDLSELYPLHYNTVIPRLVKVHVAIFKW